MSALPSPPLKAERIDFFSFYGFSGVFLLSRNRSDPPFTGFSERVTYAHFPFFFFLGIKSRGAFFLPPQSHQRNRYVRLPLLFIADPDGVYLFFLFTEGLTAGPCLLLFWKR